MANETLTFLRKATKEQDGQNGLVYRHHFGTGWQDLVFVSEEKAEAFKANLK